MFHIIIFYCENFQIKKYYPKSRGQNISKDSVVDRFYEKEFRAEIPISTKAISGNLRDRELLTKLMDLEILFYFFKKYATQPILFNR